VTPNWPDRNRGSLMELGFWFEDRSDHEAIVALTTAMVNSGAAVNGTAFVHCGADAVGRYRSHTDYARQERPIASVADLQALGADPADRVVRVDLASVVSFETRHAIPVVVSDPGRPSLKHPITVWLPDVVPWGSCKVSPVATEVRELFNALIINTGPSYATFLVEQSMPSPWNIIEKRHLLTDFYLSHDFAGAGATEGAVADGARVEHVGHGAAVWTTPEMGGRPATNVDQMQSSAAQAIARASESQP